MRFRSEIGQNSNQKNLLFAAVVIVLLSLHFYDITADPSILKSTEDIHDEAWWAENARQKILYDRWTVDGIAGALAAGPLTVAWHYMVFSIGGVSFLSLRLISLIPFSALILVMLMRFRFSAIDPSDKLVLRNTLLLLLCLPLLFEWTRLGHPETMMSCLGIASFALGRNEGKFNLLFAGAIAALGLFVKGSFVYHFAALGIVLSGFNYQHFFRRGLMFALGASSIAVPVWLFYYLPNATFFQTFQNLFAGEYYTWEQLLHPAGIIFRLMHIAQKPFLNDPLSGLLVTILLIQFLLGRAPRDSFNYRTLLLWSFLLTLGSDFSPRRLVFSLFLLPFAITEPQNESRLPWWKAGIVYSLLAIQLLPYFWPQSWLSWKLSTTGIEYSSAIWLALCVQTTIAMMYSFSIDRLIHDKKVRAMFLLVPVFLWWLMLLYFGWQRLHCGALSEQMLMLLFIACFLCLLACLLLKKLQVAAILLLSCLWLGMVLPGRSYGVADAAKFLAQKGKPGDYAIGYGLPYTLTFLSPVSPVFHPDSEKKLPVRWCIGLSSPEFPNRNISTDNLRFFHGEALQSQSFSLYNQREKAWILERSH